MSLIFKINQAKARVLIYQTHTAYVSNYSLTGLLFFAIISQLIKKVKNYFTFNSLFIENKFSGERYNADIIIQNKNFV